MEKLGDEKVGSRWEVAVSLKTVADWPTTHEVWGMSENRLDATAVLTESFCISSSSFTFVARDQAVTDHATQIAQTCTTVAHECLRLMAIS